MGAVKAIGIDAALRVAEIESAREGVGPDGQPARQIGRSGAQVADLVNDWATIASIQSYFTGNWRSGA
jgi:hypothetical protein